MYPETFAYSFYKDEGVTNRLEVALFKETLRAKNCRGLMIHMKSKGEGLPCDNWEYFEKKIGRALDGDKNF